MNYAETVEAVNGLEELHRLYAWQKLHLQHILSIKDQILAIKEIRATAVAIAQLQKEGK
jgi:hypothetical protein